MNKALLIDTTSNKEIKVGIRMDGKDYLLERKVSGQKAQVALPMIGELLEKQGIALKDLSSIEVKTGTGSFTGIRVGVTVANALSYVLKIPVNHINK